MAREYYDVQLRELKNQMLHLGSMIEETIQGAVCALVKQDVKKAEKIAKGDDKIDELVRCIEQHCYMLLLRQHPMASDLRDVSAALKMITDMERIGDHGADISEITILMSDEPYPDVIKLIEQMSKETMLMLIDAVSAFDEQDEKKANMVIEKDDVIDDMFLNIKQSIEKDILKKEEIKHELDLLMVAKYFERIGDHATNIAEWVLFSITGEMPV